MPISVAFFRDDIKDYTERAKHLPQYLETHSEIHIAIGSLRESFMGNLIFKNTCLRR